MCQSCRGLTEHCVVCGFDNYNTSDTCLSCTVAAKKEQDRIVKIIEHYVWGECGCNQDGYGNCYNDWNGQELIALIKEKPNE